ncbi:ATP-NAD kinase family protein [Parendozoicomonas haliclonae]|uniref:ATP-NAD kinase n=1 Tax=Parendozoicomonas haliclonae TaxID=1960125 RepID=A0A1X7AH10_9GAMM|nr:ATP-NAD kinase family protein [Parendozoicomonas haliclonae]SMA40367.1 ATP-NAD kinase [Parendozoicomonas haliclonae]
MAKAIAKPMTIGLIINPVAGLGGRVGLKGSDGIDIQRRARELGGQGRGVERTISTLNSLSTASDVEILTCQGTMGEDAVKTAGLNANVVFPISPYRQPTPSDTMAAARWMVEQGVSLIVFAGGDGTARNLLDAVGDQVPVLGIPAGVKVQSAVFAISPKAAGELLSRFIQGSIRCQSSEVMDLDEEELRQQRVSARLYGYLQTPVDRCLTQGAKTRSNTSDHASALAIAEEMAGAMCPDTLYLIGPGMTTAALKEKLRIDGSLIGVDLVCNGRLIAKDVSEREILSAIDAHRGPVRLLITCIGGQGFLLGRGNPQVSPEVLNRIGFGRITVLATTSKLTALHGKPLLVDTGSSHVDRMLSGYIPVITGYRERQVYKVSDSLL